MVCVVMGPAGAGKSTVGRELAGRLGWAFVEGDDFHPPANVARMRAGLPLDDEHRRPWLLALRDELAARAARGEDVVVACSALRQDYRDLLAGGRDDLAWVVLRAPPELLAGRLRSRAGHFFPAELLDSQLATLQEPAGAIVVDARLPPAVIAGEVAAALRAA